MSWCGARTDGVRSDGIILVAETSASTFSRGVSPIPGFAPWPNLDSRLLRRAQEVDIDPEPAGGHLHDHVVLIGVERLMQPLRPYPMNVRCAPLPVRERAGQAD